VLYIYDCLRDTEVQLINEHSRVRVGALQYFMLALGRVWGALTEDGRIAAYSSNSEVALL
jgi:hypothetical protein